MTKELAIQLLASKNIYLTKEGRELLEKVVSEDEKKIMAANTKM